jgi:hypothetical protein
MPSPDHSFQKPAREEANRVELATPWTQVVQNLGHSGELFQMILETAARAEHGYFKHPYP